MSGVTGESTLQTVQNDVNEMEKWSNEWPMSFPWNMQNFKFEKTYDRPVRHVQPIHTQWASIRTCRYVGYHGPLTRYVKLRVAHAPRMPGTFSPTAEFKGNRELAIPACIKARAWRTCRDACQDCLLAVAGKTFPAFPAHAHPQFDVFRKRPIDCEPNLDKHIAEKVNNTTRMINIITKFIIVNEVSLVHTQHRASLVITNRTYVLLYECQ